MIPAPNDGLSGAQSDDGLSDIACAVFGCDPGLLMTLSAYFDESIRDEALAPIFVAGYIFKPTHYRQFARRWKANVLRFKNRRFTAFHATDLFVGRGEYEGLSIPDRAHIYGLAVDVIRSTYLAGIGVHFDQREFESLAPPNWPRFLGSIYSAACQMCLQATGIWMDDNRNFTPILYVFEKGHKFRHEADCVLRLTDKEPTLKRPARYRNHLFEEKTLSHGLQAADLLAWTLGKGRVTSRRDKNIAPFMPHIVRLALDTDTRYRILTFTGDVLREWFDHQWNSDRQADFVAHVGPRKRAFR